MRDLPLSFLKLLGTVALLNLCACTYTVYYDESTPPAPAQSAGLPPSYSSQYEAPKIVDKFGFPIGTRFRFLERNGYAIRGFQPNLKPFEGVWCAGPRAGGSATISLNREALINFERMKAAAARSGYDLKVCSAYRSIEYQETLQNAYPNRAAAPHYSEHHLGTAIDLSGVYWDNERYRWLCGNAHRYGFILSHHRGHTIFGITAEANHWRYVGREAAERYYHLVNEYRNY